MNPFNPIPFWQEFFNLTTLALLILCSSMAILWASDLLLRNAAIADAGRAFGIAFCAALYAFNASGAFPRRWLLAIMVLIWGLRLGLHLLLNRILGQPENGRYQEFRRILGGRTAIESFVFYQLQAISCILLSIPFLLACMNDEPELNLLEQFAVFLWLLATSGVTVADMQLTRFKSNKANQDRVCREGLWAWSRHPNYFFECLIWLSYGLYALSAPWGFLGLIAPALMLYLLLKVTGIPPTEAHNLSSKGDEYRKYQAEVSPFFPMPNKSRAGS